MHSFRNKLKSNPWHLNYKVNRRCDDLIETLLSVEVDMFYERKRKELLTSTTEASRKQEGDRHSKAKDIDSARIHSQVFYVHYLELNMVFIHAYNDRMMAVIK